MTKKSKPISARLAPGGYLRPGPAVELEEAAGRIRRAVEARYSTELAEAGFFRQRILRSQMEAEIAREVAKIAASKSYT